MLSPSVLDASRILGCAVVLAQANLVAAGPLPGAVEGRQAACDENNSLLKQLQVSSHTAEASSFCAKYIHAEASPAIFHFPPTAMAPAAAGTVSVAAHPMKLYSMEAWQTNATPLTYGSPPTASPVPGSPGCFGHTGDTPCAVSGAVSGQKPSLPTPSSMLHNVLAEQDHSSAAAPLPSFVDSTNPPASVSSACSCLLSSSSSVKPAAAAATPPCTTVTGSYPATTVPAFCNPALHTNAPSLVNPGNMPVATATISAVSNKMDCCTSCAGIFNCVAWQFMPVWTGKPSEKLPGGFDPWGRGDCQVVYHTGQPDDAKNITTSDALAVCPNGKVHEMLSGSNNPPAAQDNSTQQWNNVYFNGWNQGSCGMPLNAGESGDSPGMGDKSSLCPGS
ncbi:hypothetical protein PG999_001275 [Apiospora kogelbergensis]|uniref:Uncharacterized protein n=1 Tax=Apiospora kogelbergensis TaxID=1337665 RepID=A0AAW0RE64_9PEZI